MRALTRVLVVEDEALIGIDLGDMLASIGARDVTLCANCDEAERAIFTEDFALAVLDVELGGESCERLVPLLEYRKVPFIITTGFMRKSLPAALQNRPYVTKPVNSEDLAAAIAAA
jgi:DNA-binding NtrC family response regulator